MQDWVLRTGFIDWRKFGGVQEKTGSFRSSSPCSGIADEGDDEGDDEEYGEDKDEERHRSRERGKGKTSGE
jgi:hypothetical protein